VPKGSKSASRAGSGVTRRSVLAGAGVGAITALAAFKRAHGLEAATSSAADRSSGYRLERDHENLIHYKNVHEGKGTIDIKAFFRAEGHARPALLLIYAIPPGASEGVHTHRPGDKKEGSFDEFYYIMEGRGTMEIEGQKVPVVTGDHVFTPNGIAHGIENTSDSLLRVYLVAMIRD
jgi:quercetin dioxygenase-like cupin family protein